MSKSGVIFSLNGQVLVPMHETPYDSEADLQRWLAMHPELLAGDQMDSRAPRRWVLIRREAGVPGDDAGTDRWRLDHLFVDQDATPTLVEVKHCPDTRSRREVVGQMLDYAANGVQHWPADKMRQWFDATCREQKQDPDAVMREFVGENGASDEDVEAFWQRVQANLPDGQITMVFVADVIPDELRRVVDFLNPQLERAEVLAVEIRKFCGDDGRTTLVPRVIGQTSQSEQKKKAGRSPGRQWDRTSLIEYIKNGSGTEAATIAERIIDWTASRGLPADFTQAGSGSCGPWIEQDGIRYTPFNVRASGGVQTRFHVLAGKPAFKSDEKRLDFVRRLSAIGVASFPESAISGMTNLPLAALAEGDRLARFFQVFDWVIEVVRAAPSASAS